MEPVYTVNEAAALRKVSPWTIWRHLTRGTLVRSKFAGRTVIRESELAKLLVDVPVPRRKRSK